MRDCVNKEAQVYVKDPVFAWKFLKMSNRFKLSAISDHSIWKPFYAASRKSGAIECWTVNRVGISTNKFSIGRRMLLQIRKQPISEEAFAIGVVGGSVDTHQSELSLL
jgi:hypothetical protein